METIKRMVVICIIFLLTLFGCVMEIHADTHAAGSCSYADVSAAINAASAGDTVTVPAGSCSWASRLTITKGIQLIGAGIGNTVITYTGTGGADTMVGFIAYYPINRELDTPFRLTGFTFNGGGKTTILQLGEKLNPPFTMQTKVRVDHNLFTNSSGHIALWCYNTFYGVIDNNQFTNIGYAIWFCTLMSETAWWGTSPQNIWAPGSEKCMYFEDNNISMGAQASCIGQYNQRYVFRYNNLAMNGIANYEVCEFHGHQDSGSMGSGFGAEVYGNKLTGGGSTDEVMFKTRGGKSFVFYNSAGTTGSWSNVGYSSLTTCGTIYPELQIIHDNYFWINRKGMTGALASLSATGGTNCVGLTNIPTAGRDMFSDSTNPGVGCGTLANRPSTCISGQGYWATDQSCSDLSGMVGANPATPISGKLYKCTAPNTWTPFYSPYTYPHPLRSGGSASSTTTAAGGAPAAPTGLKIINQ